MTYRLITNSVDAQQVRETSNAYIIENVPFVRPMRLSGGYVPEFSIEETANDWGGKPATLNHPRNGSGEPVAANQKPETHIGKIQNPHYDGEFVRGDIRINKSDIQSGEASDIQHALENGQTTDVSSQYAATELPPGEYDGEHRGNVERIVEPDSVAILPNKSGVCSLSEGCGINPEMVANADVSLTATTQANKSDVGDEYLFDNPGEAVEKAQEMGFDGAGDEIIHTVDRDGETIFMPGPTHDDLLEELDMEANMSVAGVVFEDTASGDLDESELDSEEHNLSDHYLYGEGEDKEDFSYPVVDADMTLRRGNVDAAHQLGCRGQCPSSEEHSENLQELAEQFEKPPEWALDSASKHMEDNVLRRVGRQVIDALNLGTEQTHNERGGNTPVDGHNAIISDTPESDPRTNTMDRDKLIQEITDNSALTESSLQERCNDGLQAIHDDVMEANGDNEGPDTDTTMSDNEDAITFESEDEFEEYIDEIVANRVEQRENERQKDELASDIVANSNEYDEKDAVKEDYPTVKALEDKKDMVTETSSPMPGGGATANGVQANSDVDDYPEMELGGEL